VDLSRRSLLMGSVALIAGCGGGSCNQSFYALKTLKSPVDRIPSVTADASGRLWFVIGTDSGFESRTEIYYLEGAVTFTPA
jgi:hypothetical protein